MNCWEFNNCNEKIRDNCPAYPDHGKECWKYVDSLKSDINIQVHKTPMLHCQACCFYKKFIKFKGVPKCWEIRNCGSERDTCSAFPYHGHECWEIEGTMCNGKEKSNLKPFQKIKDCYSCEYYNLIKNCDPNCPRGGMLL